MDEEEYGPVLTPHADESGTTADPAHSAVCTLSSQLHSQEHQRTHHHLGAQLGRLKQETNRYGDCKNKASKDFPFYLFPLMRHRFTDWNSSDKKCLFMLHTIQMVTMVMKYYSSDRRCICTYTHKLRLGKKNKHMQACHGRVA